MGYSCTARAAFTLDAIGELIAAPTSNGMPDDGGFYETGRERPDGAIVGTVWRKLNAAELARWAHLDNAAERVTRRGSFKIADDGRVIRFPGLPRDLLKRAEAMAADRYRETYDRQAYDWRHHAKNLAAFLRDQRHKDRDALARMCWPDCERVARGYQTDKGIAFLALPSLQTADAIAAFVDSMLADA